MLDTEQEEYLRKNMMSIMQSTNWSVRVLSSIMNGCHQEQLSSRRRKFEAWYWISKSMFRAWYNGAYCGSLHPRT